MAIIAWLSSFELIPAKTNIKPNCYNPPVNIFRISSESVTNVSTFCKLLIDMTTFVLFPNLKTLPLHVF